MMSDPDEIVERIDDAVFRTSGDKRDAELRTILEEAKREWYEEGHRIGMKELQARVDSAVAAERERWHKPKKVSDE